MHANYLTTVMMTNQVFDELGPDVFEGAIKIIWIYLVNNQISSIHEKAFDGLRSLMQLSLQGNTIHSLAVGTFEKLYELELVNLRNNLLTTLPANIFINNLKLKTIKIDTNRLLFIDALEMKAPFEKFILLDNLCVNSEFARISELNKVTSKHCDIQLTPTQLFESYMNQQRNTLNCDHQDIDELFDLKEKIHEVEVEIKQIKATNEKLNDIMSATKSLDFCRVRDEHEL